MPNSTKKLENTTQSKLEYIGLNLNNLPEELKKEKNLNYKINREFNDSTYKVYKYISVKDIEIFISPVKRLTNINEKYKLSTHISNYLQDKDNKQIELIEALSNTDIEDIQKIEEEQKILNEDVPFKVKYENSIKWQIYYSKIDNKYFMLNPLSENDNAALFYLIKEKINCIKNNLDKKIYVPICQEEYSEEILSKREIKDIENYLWYFTKKWPTVYEVYNDELNLTIQIVGKTNIYEGVESDYKLILSNKKDAQEKYKLIKALFIICSDLKKLYKFECDIDDNSMLQFLFEQNIIEFSNLENFVKQEVEKQLEKTEDIIKETKEIEEKLNELKDLLEKKNQEYSNQEKQIIMFLQCKKTFIGRVKYFLKSKKSQKKFSIKGIEGLPKIIDFIEEKTEEEITFEKKQRYTIEDLITVCNIMKKNEEKYNDKLEQIKSIEEKINILNKKIENSQVFIQEIEKHKRSIFEFWKFTNKDLPNALTEAEKLKQEKKDKETKVFNYQEDLQELGKKIDDLQKRNLSKNEIDILYAVKDYIDIINILDKNEISDEENAYITFTLNEEKQKYNNEKRENKVIYFDIFGNIDKEPEKIKELETKEEKKDKYQILNFEPNTTLDEFKETLNKFKKILEKEYNKIKIPYNMPLYCVLNQNTMEDWNIANINPANIIKKDINTPNIDIIRYNIPEFSPILFYTNNVLYNGKNVKTGINNDSEALLCLNKFDRELIGKLKKKVSIAKNEYENIIKNIKIYEYNLKLKEVNDD